jgi:hypothetical protein
MLFHTKKEGKTTRAFPFHILTDAHYSAFFVVKSFAWHRTMWGAFFRDGRGTIHRFSGDLVFYVANTVDSRA